MKSFLKFIDFKKNNFVLIIFIILLTAILYWPSFTSPFFQDDVIFLKSDKTADILTTIPDGVWRPLSFQIFYTVGKFLFGFNPLAFHLILFSLSSLSLFLIFALSKKYLKTEKKLLLPYFFTHLIFLFLPIFIGWPPLILSWVVFLFFLHFFCISIEMRFFCLSLVLFWRFLAMNWLLSFRFF